VKTLTQNLTIKLALVALIFSFSPINAQDDAASSAGSVEEITVTGSQIKGAKITGSLPVSVLDFTDIDTLGVDGGDELLDNVVENGMNLFNETENASGGVNSARGDMGAYNLRNMGTGNTLTLLNGRRLVNSPGYQTELIGGDYVPAMTVNSNLIPIYGLERMEILRDGASAIYGADAVAGVVNNVMQSDYEGFSLESKQIPTTTLMPLTQPLASNLVKPSMAVEPISAFSLITTTEKESWLLKMQDGVIQTTGNGPLATCLKA